MASRVELLTDNSSEDIVDRINHLLAKGWVLRDHIVPSLTQVQGVPIVVYVATMVHETIKS